MTQRTLIVDVDTQVDFCSPEGALFVPADPRGLAAEPFPLEVAAWIPPCPGSEQEIWPLHCFRGPPGRLKTPGTRRP
jgi:hypothetical protein